MTVRMEFTNEIGVMQEDRRDSMNFCLCRQEQFAVRSKIKCLMRIGLFTLILSHPPIGLDRNYFVCRMFRS
jgi:hypothetical protein